MRIIIDMQGMQSLSRDRGIGRYTDSFTRSFIQIAKSHEVYLLLNGLFPDTVNIIQEKFESLLSPDRFILFDAVGPANELDLDNEWNIKISELIREKMIDDIAPDFLIISSLFEGARDNSITSIGAYTSKIPTAVIFYDLIPYMRPEQFLDSEPMERWYMRKINSLKRADALLSISFSAQSEATVFLAKESSQLTTISSATDETFNAGSSDPDTLSRYSIMRPFIMHTSAYEERKNFEGLIEAFAILPETLKKKYQLVLVCKLTEEQRKHLEKVARTAGLHESDLILTGYVSDNDLVSLYTQATLFVFPSRHEGFGLPALEAMACGTATIGSDSSSIPEVIGRSDALFDPVNIESISKKIREVLTDETFRRSLEVHAYVQSKKFSWKITARKALEFLEKKHQHNARQKVPVEIRRSTDRLLKTIQVINLLPVPSKEQLRRAALAIERNEKSVIALMAQGNMSRKLRWRIEGPFDSSYSLALLNRETARALNTLGVEVALHSTEGPGDFDPDPKFLAKNPDIEQLYQKSFEKDAFHADVCSRNLYPPRVEDMRCLTNMLHHYAWEESGFPQEWVSNFNTSLDAMTCLSSHVQKIMIDNGVSVPMLTSGCGVDHWEKIVPDKTYQIKTEGFCFLHVSSCFPRKGADILLNAYGDAFNSNDEVTLIIKTFPNPHNEVHQWLEHAREKHPNYPDVVIIEEDLTEAQLKALYEQCHTLVAPSRAEGFGLPLAEAMLSGLPVITTGWGGQLDFCSNETAWLIDYHFVQAKTHFELFDSVWAEPSCEHLSELMHEVYKLSDSKRKVRSERGRKLLLENFKWSHTAQKLISSVKKLPKKNILKPYSIGWITSWNTQCGIASYSKHLIDSMSEKVTILAAHTDQLITEDEATTHRCWKAGDGNTLDALSQKIDDLGLSTLVIQFNYSFFDFDHFSSFIDEQCDKGRTILVMLHSTTDAEITPHKKLSRLIPALERCDRVLVHTPDDLNRLKSYNLVKNVAIFPHGIPDSHRERGKKQNKTFTLASYGFFLPHKGLLELITTFKILREKGMDIRLKMVNAEYPVPQSTQLIKQAEEKIQSLELNDYIEVQSDYLSDEACLEELSVADLIIFPYQETGESSSAAVRYGLATGNPVAVTPLKIFDDVDHAIFKLSGCSPEEMAESIDLIITKIKNDSKIAQKKRSDAKKWCDSHRYSALGKRLNNMLKTLHHLGT